MSTKQKTLELLEKNRGQFLSGAEMAKAIKISRNSVWKAIHSLKKEGYQIEAVSNRGYKLAEDNDILSVAGMLPDLLNEEWAPNIKIFSSLESTNKTAKELAINGQVHGTVIIADSQTAGKGRLGRSFHSPAGSGIYMSFILRPVCLPFDNPTAVTAFAAVAVCETIATLSGKTPKIKWVNDIFVDGLKICGILTEAISDLENKSFQWLVLGIGINVSTVTEDFPEALRQIAGSLYPDGKKPMTRNRFVATLINQILGDHAYGSEQALYEKYKEYLFIIGQNIVVTEPKNTYEATAIDINSKGHLIVKKADGAMVTLVSGEVSILPH